MGSYRLPRLGLTAFSVPLRAGEVDPAQNSTRLIGAVEMWPPGPVGLDLLHGTCPQARAGRGYRLSLAELDQGPGAAPRW